MNTADFDFDLPEELIAQTPLERRDASRLLVLDKNTGAWQHRHFYDLPEYLRPGDCLVLNDSRVLPARLLAQRPDVWAAQRGVAAASADVGSAQADRYPRLGLSGQITAIGTRGAGGDGQTWSVGPLQLSLPLFDAGRRASQVQVQQAAYDEAVLAYRLEYTTADVNGQPIRASGLVGVPARAAAWCADRR